MSNYDKFDEYKFLVDDTARITDRRQNTSNTYITINSILLAAITFLFTEKDIQVFVLIAVAVIIMFIGLLICTAWKNEIDGYRNLLSVRFDVLREMEEHPEMADSVKVYHREDILFPRDENGKIISTKGVFSKVERSLPQIFMGLYVMLAAIIIIASLLGFH